MFGEFSRSQPQIVLVLSLLTYSEPYCQAQNTVPWTGLGIILARVTTFGVRLRIFPSRRTRSLFRLVQVQSPTYSWFRTHIIIMDLFFLAFLRNDLYKYAARKTLRT